MIEEEATGCAPDVRRRLARLTAGQRACLMLVLEHKSSKEIARHLGISPHTVDQRMRSALKALGVDRRIEAARLLQTWMETGASSRAALPFTTRRHRHNDMHLFSRLLWIAIIAIGAAFAAGIALAAAEAVAAMVRGR